MQEDTSRRREVIGLFSSRESFERTVADLLAAGFEHADLSVLVSHESIEAAETREKSWANSLRPLIDELRYENPLVASGAIFLAGGPVAAVIAGIIGATVGGIAIKEALQDVTARPHTEEFARSLAAGNVILWVRVDQAEREETAIRVLDEHGADNVHVYAPSADASHQPEAD